MSQNLQFLRSDTPGQRPASLSAGQIAFNLADKLLFIGDGGDNIIDQNGNVTAGVAGGGFFISDLDIGTATTQAASYTDTALAQLVDGAPGVLDTLNELAAALGDDANFATTITNLVNTVSAEVTAEETRALAAESALSASITAETTRAQTAESANATAISDEITRAQTAESANAAAITAEVSRAQTAEAANAAAITAEETRALAAEGVNAAAIAAEETRALAAEAANAASIATNATDIATNATDIATNATAIAAEETRALAAESANATAIATNAAAISVEETRALAAEAANAANIATNTTDIATNTADIATLNTSLSSTNSNITALTARVEDLEDDTDTAIVVAYENNTNLIQLPSHGSGGTGVAPIEDPNYREGWYYKSSSNLSTDFLSWGIGESPVGGQVGYANIYAVMTFDILSPYSPYLILETQAQNDGQDMDAANGVRSRWAYALSSATMSSMVLGKKYLVVAKVQGSSAQDLNVHPELDRVYADQLYSHANYTGGPQGTGETFLRGRIESARGAGQNAVRLLVDSTGASVFGGYDQETLTRFRKVSLATYEAGFEQGTF